MVDLGGVLRAELATCVAGFVGSDAGPVGARTPDQIHDARVALRRIRSQLRTFRTVFEPAWRAGIRAEISWYERLLGQVRDCDVVTARLLADAGRARDGSVAATITSLLAHERATWLRPLDDAYGSPLHRHLLGSMDELASCPQLRPRARRSAGPALLGYLEHPWCDLDAAARAAHAVPTPDALHLVRIRAKQLRDGAAVATPLLGPKFADLAAACTALQSHLGRSRDADAAARWLTDKVPGAGLLGPDLADIAARERATSLGLQRSWWAKYKLVDHARKRSHIAPH
jgi:CHAD domain-containing protein